MTGKKKKQVESSVHEEAVEETGHDILSHEDEQDMAAALEEARNKLQESEEKVLRLAADFENTKKRLERERDTSLKYAEENVLKELLPGIDNIERAMDQAQEANNIDSLLEGVELTRDGLLATLEKFGVKAIKSVGEPFDPNIHEAIAMEETDEMEPNFILREFQKGYLYKERLLRPAKVIVSKPLGAGS
ncbi:nucleotide exchange factor GrpE [Thermodesulfobacteriota bacterium]